MIRRSLLVAPLALSCLLASQAIYAAPLSVFNPVHAMFGRSKMVKFDLHNASDSPMDLKAGDKVVTVKAGETITLELPPGTRILTNTASNAHPAGTLMLEVSPGFSGTTITLR
jgi:hypothetical protein